MGAVYLGRQAALGRLVAIKQILGAWDGDPEMLARFQREARALARLNHPNIVGIFDMAGSGSDLFMVMEFVNGPTLRQLIDRSGLTRPQALKVIGDVAAGLEYAGKQGVIHRDLKPGNVFVTVNGLAKLGDFGLARMLSDQAAFQTQVGTVLGTPAYMSPEQARGVHDLDARTDVYSLAVMSYELLLKRLPFPSIPGNPMASLEAHISTPPPPPTSLDPGFPRKVEEVLLQGLAKEPRQRPATSAEFWQRLSSAADSSWKAWQAVANVAALARSAAPALPAAATGAAASGVAAGASQSEPSIASQPPVPAPIAAATPAPVAAPVAAMAGIDETIVRRAGDETMVRPAGDETMVRPAPDAGDQTMVRPPGAGIAPVMATTAVAASAPPAGPPAAAPATPSLPSLPPAPQWNVQQVKPPVYKPAPAPRRKRGLGRLVPLLLLLVLLVAAGAYLYTRFGSGGAPAAALALSGTPVVRVDNPNGHCPSATFHFTAEIPTNGAAGSLTFEWLRPDGGKQPQTVDQVPSGTTADTPTLQFTFQGQAGTAGDTVLHVISPVDTRSAPVHVTYTCP